KKNTWLRNAKCFILESVPTTNTLVLHLKSESKGPWKGTTIILRNFSTSREQTGAKWTIEFQNHPLVGRKKMELKFR
ncbi:TPA: hypothetical protein ACLBFB_002210, partial [Neisseria meningitidis]